MGLRVHDERKPSAALTDMLDLGVEAPEMRNIETYLVAGDERCWGADGDTAAGDIVQPAFGFTAAVDQHYIPGELPTREGSAILV